jgi:serine protease inhibitor
MEVLLPKDGVTVEEVLNSLKSADWEKTMMSMRDYEVDVQLPKFTAEYSIDMPPVLKALGMKDMFDQDKADFSRISDMKTFLGIFRQKCTIDVNEKGTEATTVTVSSGGETANVVPNAEFHANRPFIYIITENTSGGIYFIGTFK